MYNKSDISQPVWWLIFLMLCLVAIFSLFPVYWMFSSAFKPSSTFALLEVELLPYNATLATFGKLFKETMIIRWLLNTTFVSVLITFCVVLTSALAGYALSKQKFPGREIFFWMMLLTMMIPGQVTLIPRYIMMMKFKWLNTYNALIIPGLASAWGVFLMRQFTKTLPGELIDAARMDGCSEPGIWYRVVLPLTKPCLVALTIFVIMGSWKSFFWPLIVTDSEKLYTIQVGLATFRGMRNMDWSLIMAGSTVSAIPMIVFFLAFQKYFVEGLTIGALKG